MSRWDGVRCDRLHAINRHGCYKLAEKIWVGRLGRRRCNSTTWASFRAGKNRTDVRILHQPWAANVGKNHRVRLHMSHRNVELLSLPLDQPVRALTPHIPWQRRASGPPGQLATWLKRPAVPPGQIAYPPTQVRIGNSDNASEAVISLL